MSVAVVAILSDSSVAQPLAAGFEEEGVPLEIGEGVGDALDLARDAAARSALGIGVGSDTLALVLVLSASPGRPYLQGTPDGARAFGHAAARIASQRPV